MLSVGGGSGSLLVMAGCCWFPGGDSSKMFRSGKRCAKGESQRSRPKVGMGIWLPDIVRGNPESPEVPRE